MASHHEFQLESEEIELGDPNTVFKYDDSLYPDTGKPKPKGWEKSMKFYAGLVWSGLVWSGMVRQN